MSEIPISEICYNKGYAAQYLETHLRRQTNNPDIVTAFAQDTAGDVSPNHQYDPAVPIAEE